MRLLLCLAFLAVVRPSLQADNSTTNSTSESNVTVAPTEKPTLPVTLDCPAHCPRIYIPVCARVRGRRHTYGNIYLMRADIKCARRRGVAARYRIRFIRKGHCNARRRRRRRPSRRPSTGGRVLNSNSWNEAVE